MRPLSKAPIPQLLPGRRNMAAHCSGCVFTAVSVHLDGLNAEDKFRVWVTILGHTPLPLSPPFPIWNANSSIINSYDAFTKHFKEVFELATGALSVSDQLLRLRQGTSSTHEYTLQFRTLAAASGWNEAALLSAYRQGLETSIRAQMAILTIPLG